MKSKGMQTQPVLIIEAFITTLLILGIVGGIIARSGDFVKQETLDLQGDKVVNAALAMDAMPQGRMTVPMEEYGFKYDGENIWIAFKNSEVNKSLDLLEGSYSTIEGPPNYQLMNEQLLLRKTENEDGEETLRFVTDGTIGGGSTSSSDFEDIGETNNPSGAPDDSNDQSNNNNNNDEGNGDSTSENTVSVSSGSMKHGIYLLTESDVESLEEEWLNGQRIDLISTTYTPGPDRFGVNSISWAPGVYGEEHRQRLEATFGETDRRLLTLYHFDGDVDGDYSSSASGAYDDEYEEFARQLVDLGMEDTIIAPSQEFNQDWSGKYPNNPENYGDGFARVVREMQSVDGADFEFVFAPSANEIGVADDAWPMDSQYWPDGEPAPYVAPSFYDSWGQYTNDYTSVSNIDQKRQDSWEANHKPRLDMWRNFAEERGAQMALREWGVATNEWVNPASGDNPYFVTKTIEYAREHDFAFQTYWNEESNNGGTHAIYPPDQLQESGQAWKEQVLKDYQESTSDEFEDPVTVSGSDAGIYPVTYNPDSGNQFFVAPDGSSGASGTRNDPWDIQTANERADAGDTVNLLPGTYEQNIRPQNSGDNDNPIIFRSSERHQAVISKDSGWDVHLRNGQDNVVIEGFQLEIAGAARWLRAENNQNLVIRDNMLIGTSSQAPLEFKDVNGVRFSNNVVDNFPAQKGESFSPEGDNIVIEGNYITRGWHGSVAMFQNDNNLVIRGNVFAGITGRTASCNRQGKVLFEDNVLTQGTAGPGSGGASGKFNCDDSIFRNNRLYKNWGTATTLTPRYDVMSIENTKFYNNVWDDNGGGVHSPGAIRVNNYGDASRLSNTLLKNNLFTRNGEQDIVGNDIDNQHIVMARAEDSGLEARRNVFYTGTGEDPHFRQHWSDDDHFGSGNLIEISETDSWSGWRDNEIMDDIGVPGLSIYDYRKSDTSPLVDGGEALTETTSSGSGSTVPVEDGYYFYDGWTDQTREGDRVQIGDEIARVVGRSSDSLELDRSINYDNGDPVGLPWAGSSPDIGPYESGNGGRKHVVVITNKQMVERGESTAFAVQPRNIDVEEICWQMGDGTGYCGTETKLDHTYNQQGGKGVRVRVEDSEGNYHWGTRFMMVKEPGRDDLYGTGDAFNDPTYDSDPNFDTTNLPGYNVKLMEQMCEALGEEGGIELTYIEGDIDKNDNGWVCGGTSVYD